MNGLKLLILFGFAISVFSIKDVTAAEEDDEAEEGEIEGTEPDKFPTDNEVYVLSKDNFDEFVQVHGKFHP